MSEVPLCLMNFPLSGALWRSSRHVPHGGRGCLLQYLLASLSPSLSLTHSLTLSHTHSLAGGQLYDAREFVTCCVPDELASTGAL